MTVKRVLWIADYYPRPHDLTTGVWALESAVSIQKQGVGITVLSPTPWIPGGLAFTKKLKGLSRVPLKYEIKDIPVFYPRCPHYPHRLVIKYLYNHFPYLESSLVWQWSKASFLRILDRYPVQAIHANFIYPSGFIGMQIKKRFGIPLVVHERSYQRLNAARTHRRRGEMYRRILSAADAIITPNAKMAQLIREMTQNRTSVNVMRDGASVNPIENPDSYNPSINIIRSAAGTLVSERFTQNPPDRYRHKKIVLSVGSLIERKGQDCLIRAMGRIRNEFSNIHCIIIGSGVRMAGLKKLVQKLSLDTVIEFYGQQPHEVVLNTMSWCDLFVLPSWNEPFGTVYAEAMTFSKPIIACQGQGIGEVIQNGVHGILVKQQDEISLADAIGTILRNHHLSIKLGQAGRRLVDQELNYNTLATKLIRLYEQIQPI